MKLTFRLRLALMFCGMFLLAGLALTAINYSLLRFGLENRPSPPPRLNASQPRDVRPVQLDRRPVTPQGVLRQQISYQALNLLVSQSLLILVLLTIPVFALAYLIAGWLLKPLQRVTETARDLSEHNLSKRLQLQGPKDELRELADTFDTMLERLERTFGAMKQFSANAAHELRTPLTLIRTEIEVTLADPNASNTELRQMADNISIASQRADRLVNSLLMLARSQGQAPNLEPIELNTLVSDVLLREQNQLSQAQLELRSDIQACYTQGDAVLLEHLVHNLISNAIKYNTPMGWIEFNLFSSGDTVTLRVSNSGQLVPPGSVNALFEPFRRLGTARTQSDRGVGLGLAIVQAIVAAHNGTIKAVARTKGGLDVTITFPSDSHIIF